MNSLIWVGLDTHCGQVAFGEENVCIKHQRVIYYSITYYLITAVNPEEYFSYPYG